MIHDLTGYRFGKLTVVELIPDRKQRYAQYRCRCDCGVELILSSKELSRRKNPACDVCAHKKSNEPLDLTGQKFGSLTVLRLSDKRLYSRRTWVCHCSCGAEQLVTTHDLQSGKVTHCNAISHRKPYMIDLKGKRVGMLIVLERAEGTSQKGSCLWRCRCDCGNEKIYSADQLLHGNIVSCGCYRENVVSKLLPQTLHHIDGTCVEFLNRKMRSDNTSGYTGVYRSKNDKWKAAIAFKGVRYSLGTYNTLKEAVQARKQGENMHKEFLEWYYREYSRN